MKKVKMKMGGYLDIFKKIKRRTMVEIISKSNETKILNEQKMNNIIDIDEPLILISQIQRSGGHC